MRFRPCIDLRQGKVVQIVGGTLSDGRPEAVHTNFISEQSPADFARLYQRDGLTGGHVIALGPGNEAAARAALAAWPGGMQMGGGITADNAESWLAAGASHVIVTSWIFADGDLQQNRLDRLVRTVGRDRLVLDLSCRRRDGDFFVVTDRWQRFTRLRVSHETLAALGSQCAELLVHGVDVEGLRAGIDDDLVALLGSHSQSPVTYAGGVRDLADMDRIRDLGQGRVDATIGSALDIFGGSLPYNSVISWHRQENPARPT